MDQRDRHPLDISPDMDFSAESDEVSSELKLRDLTILVWGKTPQG